GALEQEAYAPVDLAQALLAVEIVAVLGTVAVAGRPGHDLDQIRALGLDQVFELGAQGVVASPRHVVGGARRQGRRAGVDIVFIVTVRLFGERLAHADLSISVLRLRNCRPRRFARVSAQASACFDSIAPGAVFHCGAPRLLKPVQAHTMQAVHTNEDIETLQARLAALQIEHRDLDAVIARLCDAPPADELLLRRMKKRKLQLKDEIALTERLLAPDEPA